MKEDNVTDHYYFDESGDIASWFVEKEDWDFRLIELFVSLCLEVVTEDCRSRLYGNVLIKKYPHTTHTHLELYMPAYFSKQKVLEV